MNGRKYSFYILLVLAVIFAISNIVVYVQAGLDDSNKFVDGWITLAIGILFLVATIFMYQKSAIGWAACLVGVLFLLFQTLMSLRLTDINGITSVCLYAFLLLYLVDDYVLQMFHVK